MRIIKPNRLREAYEANPEWEASLKAWRKIVENASWENPADVKQSWKNYDPVGKCFVFDIAHNRCRLVVWINFRTKLVFIRHILGHAEYDEERWKDDCDCS